MTRRHDPQDDDDEAERIAAQVFGLARTPPYRSSTITLMRALERLNAPDEPVLREYDYYHAVTKAEIEADFLGYFTEPATRALMQEAFNADLLGKEFGIGPELAIA